MSDHPGGFNPNDPQRGPDPAGYGGPYPPPGMPPGYHGHPPGGPGGTIDLGAIAPGGLMAVVAGVLYFVFSFCSWYTYSVDLPYGGVLESYSGNAWNRGSGVWSALIFLLVAIAFAVKALKVVPPNIPLEIIAFGLVVLGDIFFLFAFLDVPEPISRGWGMWVCLAAVAVITAGAVLQFIKAGGVGIAKHGLNQMQQRAAGPQGGYPPPPPGQGGYPPPPPGQGGYPPPPPPPPGGYPPPDHTR